MKKIFSTLFLSTIICSNISAVQPYDSVRTIPYEPYYLPNSWVVLNQFNNREGTVFVDVGSTQNGASRYIAQNVGDGVNVYAISPWSDLGSFQQFLSNVIQENTTERIIPLRMDSNEASDSLNIIADIIYLNSDDPDTLHNNIILWSSHLSTNGAIVGDNWNFLAIELAVITAANNLGLTLANDGTLWILHR